MELIRDTSGFVANWVAENLNETPQDGQMAFGFVNKDGELICGISLHDVKEHSTGLGIYSASPRWCTPANCRKVSEVLFDTLGKRYIYTLTPKLNRRARKLAEGMGFREHGCLPECGPMGEDDLIVYGMLRRECPFLD